MVQVILDTNIYGKIFKDPQGLDLAERIKRDGTFTIHNLRLIRKELRKAPKLLPLYDSLVSKRVVEVTNEAKELAIEYFKEYKERGGRQGKKKMTNDFLIVACASLIDCDLVFSDDEKTLKHTIARQAYDFVNLKHNIRSPIFHSYTNLKGRYF